MALSASSVWETEVGGSDTNGGGFVTGSSGTDWTQQSAAQYSLTNGVTNGTTTVATVSASSDMVGNIAYIAGGTGSITAGWYQIVSQVTGVSITVDRSTGLTTGTGVTITIGGALLSPAIAAANATVVNMLIYVKYNASVFAITSASTNVAAGCVSLFAGVAMIGYNTTRTAANTDALQPTLQLQVSTATLLTAHSAADGCIYVNLVCDGNSQTTSRLNSINAPYILRSTFKNFTGAAGSADCLYCYATTNSANIFGGTSIFCEATANTATPFFASTSGSSFFGCLSYGNTGASTDGFGGGSSPVANSYVNCSSYNNGRHGFFLSGGTRSIAAVNCVATGNGGYGFVWSVTAASICLNCAAYNNTSGAQSGSAAVTIGFITLTADPFVASASSNFALNNNAGGGALLRAAGFPATWPSGNTADYIDVGAAQHQDSPATIIAMSRYILEEQVL